MRRGSAVLSTPSPERREVAGRMDFVRFSGELFIYYVLIALGGGVLTGFMGLIFGARRFWTRVRGTGYSA